MSKSKTNKTTTKNNDVAYDLVREHWQKVADVTRSVMGTLAKMLGRRR